VPKQVLLGMLAGLRAAPGGSGVEDAVGATPPFLTWVQGSHFRAGPLECWLYFGGGEIPRRRGLAIGRGILPSDSLSSPEPEEDLVAWRGLTDVTRQVITSTWEGLDGALLRPLLEGPAPATATPAITRAVHDACRLLLSLLDAVRARLA
jgi:hypothetical protein